MPLMRRVQVFGKRYGVALSLVGTAVASAVDGIWTAAVYLDSRISGKIEASRQEAREERRLLFDTKKEFQKPFFQRQMDLCLEASDAAAVLATTSDPGRSKLAADTFWRLYWGQLVAVEEQREN